jgi:hypothetical protein
MQESDRAASNLADEIVDDLWDRLEYGPLSEEFPGPYMTGNANCSLNVGCSQNFCQTGNTACSSNLGCNTYSTCRNRDGC